MAPVPPISRRGILMGLSGLGAGAALGSRAAIGDRSEFPCRLMALDIRAFGAAGDGAADDTPAFRALHKAMRRAQRIDDTARAADPNRPPIEFLVLLPPGHYLYTWNRWTWGLRRITIFGYGASIQCMHAGPYDIDQAPLIGNREHYWTWSESGPTYGGPPPVREDYGRLIRTARPGDTAVELLSARDTADFSPGAWILIQSYAQQMDGYPPNMRYFERARVMALQNATIRLDRPILFRHKENWPEDPSLPTCTGRARIVAIDRTDCPLAIRQSFLGLTVHSNPNHAVRDAEVKATRETLTICGALEGLVRDCTLIAFGVSQVERVQVQDSSIAYTEPDKIIDQLTFDNCTIGSIQECTGVNRLTLRNCTIHTTARIFAREAVVDGCTLLGAVAAGEFGSGITIDGPNPTRRMSIINSRFFGRNDRTGLPLGGQAWARFAIDGHTVRLLGGYHLEITAGSAQFGDLVARLEEGWPVEITGRTGYRFGSCLEIQGQSQNVTLGFTLSGPMEAGDVLLVPSLASLKVKNCQFTNLRREYPGTPFLTWESEVEDSRVRRLGLKSTFASRPVWLPGYPRRISCLVSRAYSGPAEACFLVIRDDNAESQAFELSIDLKMAGQREVTQFGSKLKASDRLQTMSGTGPALSDTSFIPAVSALIVPRLGAVPAPAAGSDAEQARIYLEIEVENPFRSEE
jgi:hypothetical protein